MNKNFLHIPNLKKAGFIICLFLFSKAPGQDTWTFSGAAAEAYHLTLNLRTQDALRVLTEPTTPQEHYVASLAEAIELVLNEDPTTFHTYEQRYRRRLETKGHSSPVHTMFLQAELRLQWTFVYLKFGHEFDAAVNLRHAYQLTEKCRGQYPDFLPIQRTSAILDLIIGSIPEKYNWALRLLGLKGEAETGIDALKEISQNKTAFSLEAQMVHAFALGFMLQKTQEAMTEVATLLAHHPSNRFVLFLGASLAMKNSDSKKALDLLEKLESDVTIPKIPFSQYLKGEAYLHSADYSKALTSYRWFVNHHKGKHYLKDAYFKMGMCYWINRDSSNAHRLFKQARQSGVEITEADKNAASTLSEKELPHIQLSKARYYTDGGFYKEALVTLDAITAGQLPTLQNQTEYYYRRARLLHHTNQEKSAAVLYRQVTDMADGQPWYFAPNAYLQLGYIASSEGDLKEAEAYFKKALRHPKHPYKNSIDSKAKSALAQLNAAR